MAVKSVNKINWFGNQGSYFSNPGTEKTVKCGICGRQMNVERNVLGATSWAESMGHGKHLNDRFVCPNINKDWHEKVVEMKIEACNTVSERIKKVLEEEILELLEANAVR